MKVIYNQQVPTFIKTGTNGAVNMNLIEYVYVPVDNYDEDIIEIHMISGNIVRAYGKITDFTDNMYKGIN